MARKALGPAALEVVAAIDAAVDAPMLVASSGGADSTALALGAAVVGKRRELGVRAIVVDHGLQDGSDGVARATADRLGERGIATEVVRVQVTTDGEGVEAAARTARHQALAAACRDGECLLLGHTLDDQAETVLLGLARGSGARSLAGMRPRRPVWPDSGDVGTGWEVADEGVSPMPETTPSHVADRSVGAMLLRPLLGVRAATTRQACREWGVEWWDDPHNDEDRFARARVRHTVLPVLEAQLGPGVAQALARSADLIRDDADLLDELAAQALAGSSDHRHAARSRSIHTGERGTGSCDCAQTSTPTRSVAAWRLDDRREEQDDVLPPFLDVPWLAGLPPALRTRVLRDWLRANGADVAAVHVRAVEALVTQWRGQRWVDVPGQRVVRRADRLVAQSE